MAKKGANGGARTEEDILDELHRLDDEKQAIRQRMLELHQELSVARAREQLAGMGDGQRAALLQLVQTEGVHSAEAVQ